MRSYERIWSNRESLLQGGNDGQLHYKNKSNNINCGLKGFYGQEYVPSL